MNSNEFAEYQPTLNASQARKTLEDHGFDSIPEDLYYTGEHVGGVRYWLTQDVFNWLGY